MEQGLPKWMMTEAAVKSLFRGLGFETQEISIDGRQIDLIATRKDTLSLEDEVWAVEITDAYVAVDKGSKDAQKLLLAKSQGKANRALLVSTAGFTDDQRATLKALGIVPVTYEELESRALGLRRYVENRLKALAAQTKADIGFDPMTFVPTYLAVSRDVSAPESSTQMEGLTWIDDVIYADGGVVGALLGDLGSGKSTLLQHAEFTAHKRFLENPSCEPVVINVPLSKYKHYAGRIDSLIQETLRIDGVDNYPSGLVRSLASLGRLIFFFDGLDEVHPISSVDEVADTVTQMLDYVGRDVRMIVSSRSHLFGTSDEELAMFGPYTKRIVAGTSARLNTLLEGTAHTQIARIAPFTRSQIEEYVEKSFGADKAAILHKIDSMYGLGDLARTPVLLSMMRSTLPELGKDATLTFPELDLYRAYVNRWIKRDDGRARLSSAQRLKLSRTLAVQLMARDDSSASWSEIREMLHEDSGWQGNPVSDREAELDVRNSTFLVREGNASFRFAHRSIMELLAAEAAFESLHNGESRRFPQRSDGFARFLRLHMICSWQRDETPPVPRTTFRTEYWEDAQLLPTILESTHNLKGPSLRVRAKSWDVRDVDQSSFIHACNIDFEDSKLAFLAGSGRRSFEACSFRNCSITLEGESGWDFTLCRFSSVTIAASGAAFRRVRFLEVQHDDTTADTPVARQTTSAARFLTAGGRTCSLKIDDKAWTIDHETLHLCRVAINQVRGASKVSIENFNKGKNATMLTNGLDALLKSEILKKDTSRTPHQLSLGDRGKQLLSALDTDFWRAHELLAAVRDCM